MTSHFKFENNNCRIEHSKQTILCVATQVDFGKFLRLFVRPKLGLISTTCNTLANNYFAHKNHRSLIVSEVVSSAEARSVFGAA